MLYISSVTFGGGFVIVNFIKKTFVEKMHWITEDEMLDMIALAQSSPGAIAVNTAILMGWNIAGFWGMVAAVLGIILPPMTIITVISFFYELSSLINILHSCSKACKQVSPRSSWTWLST